MAEEQAYEGELPEIQLGHAPDGTYECMATRPQIVSVGGKPNLVIHWVVSGGEWEGENIPDFYDLARGIWRLKRMLDSLNLGEKLGLKSVNPKELPELLEGMSAEVEVNWDEDFARYKVASVLPTEE